MKVVGEAEVEDVLIDNPEIIWKKTKKKSGIDKNYFDQYYENRDKAVAYKLKNVKKYIEPKELKDIGFTKYENGKPLNVGTVHTFQGKENKVVFLVLGASDKEKGAASWAVSKPNIINVAATRAKTWFFIIGDKKLYQSIGSDTINKTINAIDNYNRKIDLKSK